MLILTWQAAVIVAGVLLAAALTGTVLNHFRPHRALEIVSAAARESGIILALFGLWQVVRILAITRVAGGIRNGEWLWHTEQRLHLPSELGLERFMLRHEGALRLANTFYSNVHFPAMIAFLCWLFIRHRACYPSARNTIVLLTGSCLLIQVFLPVAPPRMLTSVGFVDEAVQLGQSVYGEFGGGVAAQLSAMPSVHVAWAFLIAVEVIRVSPSRWRWLIVVHPILTTFVVVVTANHYWADGIVAVALLALAELGSRAIAEGRRRFWPAGGLPALTRQQDGQSQPPRGVPGSRTSPDEWAING
ncbi:phosphatase PAP2 family protein [Frankia sp. AgB1.9]|uniref:phosphatase PAP2 family protein n=1 Tax=unclassified Frankia TaxID=2632575 RepID=UPI00193284A0|nr:MULTISPECIES: phosphatase PAP2 family protein [unclassified Frankia]MBL7488579.1 phosphatase PAP2 family protein [Frankia sp. AgW1.1]MBL7550613.1 phosphatase PAP2 family protein [Frankia sp. AgB1.9]MBL7619794.1 phosphatase PAP2 family protein [Frankia sp. AgB1.8]